ncbi:ABC transporter ATP-binding protein [Dickeya zeae]|uniref:ABC transporter ATP-binding protein n=1 Tax=Dickeya zeae TaxID=204042 RepID=UPI00143FD32B|nr:ABC transporter ATP-binding protein [Dickeya zeae]QIZ46010.1 ABC transporter ATP-binding protein [Dickeya zeae]
MTKIEFENVTLRYPIYDSHGMSLRNQLVRIATGGIIEKNSGNTTVITALKNVSFHLEEGDSVGLIGHNGAGKSTLLRTMAGIYTPEEGKVVRKGKTATVFEIGAGLEPELPGYDNIINIGMMLGLSYSEARALTPDIEEFTGLGGFLDLPVRTYSSGMTMRLMFAVATAISPEILLLDEMFSTGDSEFQQKSRDRIHSLISSAKIFVFASHNIELIKEYCNRVFYLEQGSLREIPIAEL